MTDKSNWPHWLRDADTENAQVKVLDGGYVIWHDGVWLGGEWFGGVWRGGKWHDGVWRGGRWLGGVWLDGIWHGGTWLGGMWYRGEWRDGTWLGGVWRGGNWLGGCHAAARAYWVPVIDDSGRISIGCQTKTRDEWEAVIAGGECEGAPDRRDKEAWRLLIAAYRAACAYEDALAAQEEERWNQ